MSISTLRTVADLRAQVLAWRLEGLSIGLVPTMGALHAGHLSLVQAALKDCQRVIVTLFVNPTQFGEGEDFADYPRNEEVDRDLVASEGAHVLFAPDVDEMYPGGSITEVQVPGLDAVLEGVYRPGHFTGVATVVTKLLLQSLADRAYFGQKDYQQLQVIKTLARDLCIPTEIIGVETLREADGLAMSSRNIYLTKTERAQAPQLNAVLRHVAKGFRAGGSGATLCREGEVELAARGFGPVDYVAIVDATTLQPVEHFDTHRPTRVLAAAKLGRARLIDNIDAHSLPE
ncbi:pantoate--beta-alanine ligase [Magnetovibrio blakemorei]|uniref:Pantothenate synthetase n=1 Tax=Magnetovibrio blakemorei TaxID=28181 RepID=A0A1E5QB35_9PROT|nr:pantoate--beta-alanine ligase [Magnetovibrio blakemorei]OEJ69242.1 pantoate--beta-alanine ligase [Magnetovibrio blakemorei]